MSARAKPSPRQGLAPEQSAAITKLLDHIAAELAAEYVRLLEATVERDRDSAASAPQPSSPYAQGGYK